VENEYRSAAGVEATELRTRSTATCHVTFAVRFYQLRLG
jgi:hypothetical protein